MTVKHFSQVAAIAAVTFAIGLTARAEAQVGVTVNGSAVDIAPPPIVQAGRVFVPLRGVFEQLGASVVYSNGTIDANGNGRDISLQIGSTQATVNGQAQLIDVAPFIVGSSTYVPLRFISEALGDSVSWDEANAVAAIDTGGGPATYYAPGTASYIDTPPPPIPDYEQPYVPEPNVIWQPGYWAWGSYGYYWVPGTWVAAPQTGYLWTPGYWQWNNFGYVWNPGYWALAIGFYGGINYGGGYFGRGYDGGRWSHNTFEYNSFVTRVDQTHVHNVYVNRDVYANNLRAAARVAFNGGRGGVQVRPTSQELSVARDRHLGMTDVQRLHVQTAEADRRLLATVNRDKPAVLAVARPLNTSNRPAGFVPVKPADRINPQANVAPVHVPRVRTAGAPPKTFAGHPPSTQKAPVAHAPAAHEAPVAHAPPAVHEAPVAHAPAAVHEAPVAHAPAVHEAPPAHAPAAVHEAPVAHAPSGHEAPPAHAPAAVHEAPVAHSVVEHPPAAYVAPAHVAPAHVAPPEVHVPVQAQHAVAPHVPAVYAAPPVRHVPVTSVAGPPHAPAVHAAPPAAPLRAAPQAHPAAPAEKKDEKPPR